MSTRLLPSVVVVCALLLPAAAFAQGGSIGGTIRDTTGAVLPGVTVEAFSSALIEKVRTATSDDRGQYLIVDLRPGTYTVTFTLAGFTTVKREGLQVSAAVTLPINVELKVGAVEETITVTGETPVVDVQNVQQTKVLTHDLLDAIPRAHNEVLIAALMPGMVNSTRDVGGSAGEAGAGGSNTIHGGTGTDQVRMIDGLWVHDFTSSGNVNNAPLAEAGVQEYTVQTSAVTAENQSGGVMINVVPKEGGNTFRGSFVTDFTTPQLNTNKISDELKARWSLTDNTKISRLWNINPAFGGPIVADRLWFFTSYYDKGLTTLPFGAYYPDGTPAKNKEHLWAPNGRLTWQASSRNKVTVYYSRNFRQIPFAGVSSLVAPSAATHQTNPDNYVFQAKWSSPVTNRLLLEAATTSTRQNISFLASSATQPDANSVLEQTIGFISGNGTTRFHADVFQWGFVGSASYVTGSNSIKVGIQHYTGHRYRNLDLTPAQLILRTGVPFQVRLFSAPTEPRGKLKHDLGIYIQDAIRIRRLTINAGLRYDYFNGEVGEQSAPGATWAAIGILDAPPTIPDPVLPRSFAPIHDVPNWKDLNPRLGLAYDLFGNGKTAFKTSINRYVKVDASAFTNSINPMAQVSTGSAASDTRTWNDLNGDRRPQYNELGPSTNQSFGLPVFPVVPDAALTTGWGARQYNWEYSASVQQQVVPGLALTVGYFRRWYGNLTWNNITGLDASDFAPFSIVNPVTGQSMTLYNVSAAKRAVTNSVLQVAPDDKQVFNGFDFVVNGRLGQRGGLVNGGVTFGRTATATCTQSNPNNLIFCRSKPPFFAQTQYKVIFAHALPYGVEGSFVYQNLPGAPISANYTVTSAIAGVTLNAGSIVTRLIEPGTRYGDRSNQFDVRLTRTIALGKDRRIRPEVGIYNLFNSNDVLGVNATYGPTWQRPTSILTGRMAKLGVQVDF